MNKIYFIILYFLSFSVQATPDKLEVIFLSHSVSLKLQKMIEPSYLIYKQQIADITLEEAKKNCTPMGDGCFNPQYGFIEEETEKIPFKEPENVKLKTINSLETNLVDCKEGNYFDIFCGKAGKASKPAPIELWIDTSSSMRNVDRDINSKTCYRKNFVNNILDQCPKNKVDVSVYNNSLKLMGSTDTLCLSYGMNSPTRFKEWIKASTAKHLFIVTDIDEMTGEMSDFLEKHGAIIRGIGATNFSAQNLDDYVKDFLKTCQNI